MTRAVTKKGAGDLSAEVTDLYEGDANAGYEEADQDAYAVPFLAMLQAQSPQCLEGDGAYVEGARAGMLYDTVEGIVFDVKKSPLKIVPVHYQRRVGVWTLRDEGGGFHGEISVQEAEAILACPLNDSAARTGPKGEVIDPRDQTRQFVDTRKHYVMYQHEGDWQPAIIALTSTQIKKSRRLMTQLGQVLFARRDGSKFKPPMWASVVEVTSMIEKNDLGTWQGWKFERTGNQNDPDLAQACKAFREQLISGEVKDSIPPGTVTDREPGEDDDIAF